MPSIPTITVEAGDDGVEHGDSANVRFTRTGDPSQLLTLNLNLSFGGTASYSTDYFLITTQVVFDPGNIFGGAVNGAVAGLSLYIADDMYFEPTETIVLTIEEGDGYLVGAANSATMNIIDNDQDLYTFNVAENSANGTVVGTVEAYNPNNDSLTYSITAGNNAGAFAINANTGQITVPDGTKLNHENTPQYTLTVQINHGTFSDTTLVIINVTNVNEAPEFNDPDNPDVYTVNLGWNHKIGKDIQDTNGQPVARATDPDGNALTYSIIAGATDKFEIHPTTGNLTLKVNAIDLPDSNYSLTIQVSDGTLTDTATVNITMKEAVGIAGDTHAIEGSADDIIVRFIRYAKDPNAGSLTATYTVNWDSAVVGDLENSTDKTNFLTLTVTFGVGETEKVFTLSAGADGVKEGIEIFGVGVNIDANLNYIPVAHSSAVKDKKKEGIESYSYLNFHLLDGVTLFAKQNRDGNAVDDVDGNGALNNDDLTNANPGIYIDDIMQGGLGDCYLMAAFGALAIENWGQIQSRFTAVDATTYNVTLWNGTAWQDFQVSIDLNRGFGAAQLTGDVDANGFAEIWPILLEKAYAQLKGGYEAIGNGGFSHEPYTALTGLAGTTVSTAGKTAVQIAVEINNARGVGKQIVLNTKESLPDNSPIVNKHAYVIKGVTVVNGDAIYTLYNPWGGTQAVVDLSAAFLDDYFDSYEVLPNVP